SYIQTKIQTKRRRKMRKVKYSVANSLDNFISKLDGGVDWLLMDGDYGMDVFFKSIDAVLLGRETYEFALGHNKKQRKKETKSRSATRTYVFSRTLKDAQDENI